MIKGLFLIKPHHRQSPYQWIPLIPSPRGGARLGATGNDSGYVIPIDPDRCFYKYRKQSVNLSGEQRDPVGTGTFGEGAFLDSAEQATNAGQALTTIPALSIHRMTGSNAMKTPHPNTSQDRMSREKKAVIIRV